VEGVNPWTGGPEPAARLDEGRKPRQGVPARESARAGLTTKELWSGGRHTSMKPGYESNSVDVRSDEPTVSNGNAARIGAADRSRPERASNGSRGRPGYKASQALPTA
jgi:hypothetical protein